MSKKLGVKKTIARISNTEFLTTKEINFAEVGIDYMISPEYLAAKEIEVLLNESVFNDKIELTRVYDALLFHTYRIKLRCKYLLISLLMAIIMR